MTSPPPPKEGLTENIHHSPARIYIQTEEFCSPLIAVNQPLIHGMARSEHTIIHELNR